jgi:outer membrane protein assembly factor BamB
LKDTNYNPGLDPSPITSYAILTCTNRWTASLPFVNESGEIDAEFAVGNDGSCYVPQGFWDVFALTNAPGQTNTFTFMNSPIPWPNTCYLTNAGVKWLYQYPYGSPNIAVSGDDDGFTYSSVAIGLDGTVYVVSDIGQLFALNPANGALEWVSAVLPDFNYVGGQNLSSPAIGSDGTVYYGQTIDFFAVDPTCPATNGVMQYKWVYTSSYTNADGSGLECFCWAPVIGSDGTIYVETMGIDPGNSRLYAFDPKTGVPKWINTVGGPSDAYPEYQYKRGSLAVAADGEIYLADLGGTFYSFCPNGGTNYAYQPTDQHGDHLTGLNSPLVGPDGTIYVEAADSTYGNFVFAFAGPSPVACSSWPEHGKNARRSPSVALAQAASSAYSTNSFQFAVSGISNMPVCICASSNLAIWTNISQITLPAGATNFVDKGAGNYQARFYMAKPQ